MPGGSLPDPRLLPLLAATALLLGACGPGEPPPPAPPAPAPVADIEAEIFPHVSARMPAEGLEPDGRMAPWALGAQLGATLHALAEACGQHDPVALRQMQEERRGAVAGEGVSVNRFDVVWTWAYRQARQKISMETPDELGRGCASLREMQQEAERMEQMLRPMASP